MTDAAGEQGRANRQSLEGRRVAFVGRLMGMDRRSAQQRVREAGGIVVERAEARVDLVVVGEASERGGDRDGGLALRRGEGISDELRAKCEQGAVELVGESELWQRLGLVPEETGVRRRYTAAMLAEVLGQSTALVRQWQRRGLLVPAEVVQRLAYFDFEEVTVGRRLAQLAELGVSPGQIARKLEPLAKLLGGAARPLADPRVVIEGRELFVRQGEGLVEAGGQLRLDFEAEEREAPGESAVGGVLPLNAPHEGGGELPTVEELVQLAEQCVEHGRLKEAAEAYRSALAAGGPNAEVSFLLAEALYRMGDIGGARERYYAAIELEEGFVEARANLGCVLAGEGELELAVAAFEGALVQHAAYPDAHYHLARVLDDLGRDDEARKHWQAFLELSPQSPWCAEASERLARE